MTNRPNLRIFSLFAFIVIASGLAWPINKIGLMYMSPLWFTAMRLAVGTVTMAILAVAMRKFSWPMARDIPLILVIGLLQISIYIWLTNIGLSHLPAGRSSLLAYTTPLWVMPAAVFFFHEDAGWRRWLGFILGISGLMLLLSPWEMNWHDYDILFGSAMLILAAISWAISILCVRYMHWTKTPLELMAWQLLIGTAMIVLFAVIKEPAMTATWNTSLVLSLLYTGIVVTGLTYWCGVIINRELPTSVLSLGYLAVPVLSLAISALFMGEVISLSTGISMLLIILGLIFIVS